MRKTNAAIKLRIKILAAGLLLLTVGSVGVPARLAPQDNALKDIASYRTWTRMNARLLIVFKEGLDVGG